MRRFLFTCLALPIAGAIVAVTGEARADETAEYCSETDLTCETAPLAFAKEVVLPVQGGFDTGWVPANSPLQVHVFAQLFASSFVNLQGNLQTTWPEALTLEAIPEPGLGDFGIHYGVDIGAQAHIEFTVLGQTFQGTFDIPYVPQFDFQVDASTAFDPWAFDGVTVDGSTLQQTLVQVSATDFIGLNIPGLDGGFELDTFVDLTASYKTNSITIKRQPSGMSVAGGDITMEGQETSDTYANETSIDYAVQPVGEIVYDGILHLIPAFYIETIGPDFSIPVADIPIPFNFVQKDWVFDPVIVHVPFPDVAIADEGPEIDPSAAVVVDLGEIELGNSATAEVSLGNAGEALLGGSATTDAATLTIAAPDFAIDPGGAGALAISFTPSAAGDQVATIIVASNDPDEPSRAIEVRAHVSEPQDIGDGDGDGDDDDGDSVIDDTFPQGGGCACTTPSSSPNRGALALGLAALALSSLRRRSKR